MLTIYAPASMANLSVGFDLLGAAISPVTGALLGDCITIDMSTTFSLINKGRFVGSLPVDEKENLVYQCWVCFCQALGKTIPVAITLEKNMPIGSGLGSSACSIVATMVALNEYQGHPFNEGQLLRMMGELEGHVSGGIHYDNVAPCYLGGMQLIVDGSDSINQSLPFFSTWDWIVAYPGISVSTAAARSILPDSYSKKTCIEHSAHLAGFVHACHTKQPALAAALMKDVIAEPYRQQLLPGFTDACQVVKALGGIAAGISGSGPTLFAVSQERSNSEAIAEWLKKYYLQNSDGFVHICKINTTGAHRLD